jgi:hypothetical protein
VSGRQAGNAQPAGSLRTRGKRAHSTRPSGWQDKPCKAIAKCMYGKAESQCWQTAWARQARILKAWCSWAGQEGRRWEEKEGRQAEQDSSHVVPVRHAQVRHAGTQHNVGKGRHGKAGITNGISPTLLVVLQYASICGSFTVSIQGSRDITRGDGLAT